MKSNYKQLTGIENLFSLRARLGEAPCFQPKRRSKLGLIQQTFNYGAGLVRMLSPFHLTIGSVPTQAATSRAL